METARAIIGSGTISNFEYITYEIGYERLHQIQIIGKVGRCERIGLYNELLSLNKSNSFFCILDNRGNFENILSFDDIKYLDSILIDAGIKYFYGATVTNDTAYPLVVKMAEGNAVLNDLDGEIIATDSISEAEEFIADKITMAGSHR